MTKAEFVERYEQVFSINGLDAFRTEALADKFFRLCDFFLEANKSMNLTAIRDENGVISKHFADCLLAAKHLPAVGTLLDVGSGGGMPALPFAITHPSLLVTALDATAKKTAYIARAAEALSLPNVSVLTGRAEELGAVPAHREVYDVVSARAVAELRILMEWCAPFLKVGGTFLALKGKNGDTELAAAENAAKELGLTLLNDETVFLAEPWGETEENERRILVFRKTKRTAPKYPRRNAQIMKSPL